MAKENRSKVDLIKMVGNCFEFISFINFKLREPVNKNVKIT